MSSSMNIKAVIKGLGDRLKNDSGLAVCEGRIYVAENILDLLKNKAFPFVNIEFVSFPTGNADNVRPCDYQRYEYTFTIQFSVTGESKNIVVMGIDADPEADPPVVAVPGVLDLHELIMDAIKTDPTLAGAVEGLTQTPSMMTEVFRPVSDELLYVGAAEMTASFYKDVFVR